MASRRTILKTGAAAAVITMTGAVGWAWAPGATAKARAPWRQAGESFGDPRLDALAYAILAPNPHNRQPWMFRLRDDDRMDVSCDLDRRLPETDPFDRQITIGFGAMLELLRMAAAENGHEVDIDPFPEGEPSPRLDSRLIATTRFSASETAARDPLFQESLHRRTTRAPFDDRSLEGESLNSIIAAARTLSSVHGTIEPEMRAQLIDLARRSWIIEYESDAKRRESIDLIRISNRAMAENPDGIAIGGTAMGLMNMTGIVTSSTLDTPGKAAYEQGLGGYLDLIESARGFLWLISEANTRLDQLQAGRDWVRINLAAQSLGVAVHPLSQALQEFPEMAAPYAEAKQLLGAPDGGVIQMLGRAGYAKFPPPAPRWPLSSRLIPEDA